MIYIHVREHTNAIVLNYAIDTQPNVQRQRILHIQSLS